MDDNLRNQLVEKIAKKISEEEIPYADPSTEVIEYLQKFAISLGAVSYTHLTLPTKA